MSEEPTAISFDPVAFAPGVSQLPDAAPLVVWLRGDEPYVEEFSLDVDQVMARLGIKRTRLTQISGRELRVGRIRRGRYIAPVYRPIDVESYAAWTRPTASHLKSSQALEDAAERVVERVHEGVEALLTDELQALRRDFREERRRAADAEGERSRAATAASDRAERRSESVIARLAALEADLDALRREVAKVSFLDQALSRDFLEFGAALRVLAERQGEHEARVLLAVTPVPAPEAPAPKRHRARVAPKAKVPNVLQRQAARLAAGDKQKSVYKQKTTRRAPRR